jgi:hypothetical protein
VSIASAVESFAGGTLAATAAGLFGLKRQQLLFSHNTNCLPAPLVQVQSASIIRWMKLGKYVIGTSWRAFCIIGRVALSASVSNLVEFARNSHDAPRHAISARHRIWHWLGGMF